MDEPTKPKKKSPMPAYFTGHDFNDSSEENFDIVLDSSPIDFQETPASLSTSNIPSPTIVPISRMNDECIAEVSAATAQKCGTVLNAMAMLDDTAQAFSATSLKHPGSLYEIHVCPCMPFTPDS